MKILKEVDLDHPIMMGVADKLEVGFNGETVTTHFLDKPQFINRVIIFEVQDEFGFKTGIGAMLGEKN
jgi:hypothetical protein